MSKAAKEYLDYVLETYPPTSGHEEQLRAAYLEEREMSERIHIETRSPHSSDLCMACDKGRVRIYVFLLGTFQARLCEGCLKALREAIATALPGTNTSDLMQPLYDEYGREAVGVVRRELTIKKGAPPNYVELVAELMRRQGCPKGGDPTPPVRPCAECGQPLDNLRGEYLMQGGGGACAVCHRGCREVLEGRGFVVVGLAK